MIRSSISYLSCQNPNFSHSHQNLRVKFKRKNPSKRRNRMEFTIRTFSLSNLNPKNVDRRSKIPNFTCRGKWHLWFLWVPRNAQKILLSALIGFHLPDTFSTTVTQISPIPIPITCHSPANPMPAPNASTFSIVMMLGSWFWLAPCWVFQESLFYHLGFAGIWWVFGNGGRRVLEGIGYGCSSCSLGLCSVPESSGGFAFGRQCPGYGQRRWFSGDNCRYSVFLILDWCCFCFIG